MDKKVLDDEANDQLKDGNRRAFIGLSLASAIVLCQNAGSGQDLSTKPKKKPKFEDLVIEQLDEIKRATAQDSAMQLQITSIREELSELSSKFDDCNKKFGDISDLQVIKETIAEIKQIMKLNT